MHEPIRENLEDYLNGSAGKIPQEFHSHLTACEECASELRLFDTQSKMLRSLHDAETEPRAGFYARVMDRIDEQKRSTMWSLFLEPAFGRRLALASAALVVLLGSYLVTTELTEPAVAMAPVVVTLPETPAIDVQQPSLQQQRQRDAVLVNLASFRQ